MNRPADLFFVGLGGLLLAAMTARLAVSSRRAFRRPNYRGSVLPLVLGTVAGGATLLAAGAAAVALAAGRSAEARRLAVMLGAVLLTLLAGRYDDLRAGPGRGLLGHVGELFRGRVTSGIVKLAALIVAGALVALGTGGRAGRVVLGIPLMAGSANAWNLLDVAPGRALKYFLPAVVALVAVRWRSEYAFLAVAALGAGVAAFPIDLRERAMLGDAGSNVLGLVVGIGLFEALPAWGLAVALAAVVALHAVAETVTLSRVIQASPPLRWFDGLGRVRHPEDEPSASG